MDHDAFSVVVPAYNAAATLPSCLDGLRAARPAPAEVIVYDDGSTDDTAEIARAAGARVVTGRTARAGPAVGRNRAAREARTATVVFVDADVVVEPEAPSLLAAAVRAEPQVVAAFGAYGPDPAVSNIAGRYANLRHHHTHTEAGARQDGQAETFWSGLGAVDRAAFLSVGGFDEGYGRPCIEDVELGARLRAAGGEVRIVPTARGDHLKDWTLRQLWHTDVFCRAVPWSRLIATGRLGDTLNTTSDEKAKSLIAHGVWASALAALFVPALLALTLVLAAAYLWTNRSLLGVLRRDSRRLAVAGAGLHWLYHLYASAVFGAVLAWTGFQARMDRRGLRRRPATS